MGKFGCEMSGSELSSGEMYVKLLPFAFLLFQSRPQKNVRNKWQNDRLAQSSDALRLRSTIHDGLDLSETYGRR